MRKQSELNCPNCGAPITGEYCPYCGSVFYDWAALDVNEPKYIKFKLGSKVVMAKAIMRHYVLDYDQTPATIYANNDIFATVMSPPTMTIATEFEVIPEDGVMYKVIDEKGDIA